MSAPRIAAITAFALRIPFDHWGPSPAFAGRPRTTLDTVLVQVTTDGGTVGWGEAYGGFWSAVVPAIDQWVAPLAIGQNVDDVALPARIERTLHNLGRAGATIHAISGLDIALWDIRGKLAGVPVSTLLGGRVRDRIEVYASLLQYNGELERVRRIVGRALGEGFKQIKLHERTADAVAAARDVAGPGVPLMVDTNCAWLPADAIDAVAEMAPSDLLWIEEPIWPPEDFASLAALRHATGVATAIGENAGNALDFKKMLADDCVDYVQPSVIKIGGLTPLWRICTESEAAGTTCVPHSPFFGCWQPRRARARWNDFIAILPSIPAAASRRLRTVLSIFPMGRVSAVIRIWTSSIDIAPDDRPETGTKNHDPYRSTLAFDRLGIRRGHIARWTARTGATISAASDPCRGPLRRRRRI
jgi:L-alanine-DL-glutamate epimerase-like enolase superfamily enzyme